MDVKECSIGNGLREYVYTLILDVDDADEQNSSGPSGAARHLFVPSPGMLDPPQYDRWSRRNTRANSPWPPRGRRQPMVVCPTFITRKTWRIRNTATRYRLLPLQMARHPCRRNGSGPCQALAGPGRVFLEDFSNRLGGAGTRGSRTSGSARCCTSSTAARLG
jgi:hypothetical protein